MAAQQERVGRPLRSDNLSRSPGWPSCARGRTYRTRWSKDSGCLTNPSREPFRKVKAINEKSALLPPTLRIKKQVHRHVDQENHSGDTNPQEDSGRHTCTLARLYRSVACERSFFGINDA